MTTALQHDSIREEIVERGECAIKEKEITISARGILLNAKASTFNKIPLLETMLAERIPSTKDKDGNLYIDLNFKVLYACISYAASGCRSTGLLLTYLSVSIDIDELISTADYLMIDIRTISSLEELQILEKKLKDIKSETMDKVARHTFAPSGDKPDRLGARDAAAELCFSLNQQYLNLKDNKIKSKVITDVLFVVSHAKTFGPRIRTHIWHAFQKIVSLTTKQMKMFDNWVSNKALEFDFNCDSDSNIGSDHVDGDCSDGAIDDEYWSDEYEYWSD